MDIVQGRIHMQVAPQAATEEERAAISPFVLATYQGGIDTQPLGRMRVMTRALYQIAVCYIGAPDEAVYTASDRVDELMGNVGPYPLTIASEPWVFDGRREQPLNLTQFDSGIYYERLGGLYRINAYKGA